MREEGYGQTDIDHLFTIVVPPKICYVYDASSLELTTVQNFLRRQLIQTQLYLYLIDIYDLVEKSDYAIFDKTRNSVRHPLH